MKFRNYLIEEKDDIKISLMKFFKDNPNPPDSKIHKFAEDNDIEPDDLESIIYEILSSFMAHGRFNESGKDEKDIDSKELEMGIDIEKEHTIYPQMARRIALDHLAEFPRYYTALLKMEKELEKELKSEK